MLRHIWLFVTLWPIACWDPLSMKFSRQEFWSGLPCPPPPLAQPRDLIWCAGNEGGLFTNWATTSFYFYFSKGKMWEKICFESRLFLQKNQPTKQTKQNVKWSVFRVWKKNNFWNVSLVHDPKRHRTINEVLSSGWSMRFRNHASLYIFTMMVEYCNYPHFP